MMYLYLFVVVYKAFDSWTLYQYLPICKLHCSVFCVIKSLVWNHDYLVSV